MKNIKLFSIFFVSFCLTIILQSCSNENLITTPTENKGDVKPMAKTVTLPIATIDHARDTIITFPKSGKTLAVSKSYTIKQLAQIDNYLATHNVPIISSPVRPYALACNDHYTYDYVMTNTYEPYTGKNIGVWCDYMSPTQLNNWGFNKLFINNITTYQTDIANANTAGFTTQNIVFGLSGNFINDYNLLSGNNPPNVEAYYLDEVEERGYYNESQIRTLGNLVASKCPGTNFYLSSYNPFLRPYYYLLTQNVPNTYIMCDEYNGDCYGTVSEYWTAFQQNLYPGHNNANWMSVVANDMNCDAHSNCDGNCSDNWAVLLQQADNLGENTVWLFAAGTGDSTRVQNFSYIAWEYGWMFRWQETLATEWQCDSPNPCTNCTWPNGNWYIVKANIYEGGYWVRF
ncbi:MAG: hypothetical protein M1480_14245 [Bacteroidetes bacterium]|nr:hypothetical protein [Bacteroidota bacterium]